MDAVEFYKAFKRMCDKTDCRDCLLDQKCRPSANVEPEEVVGLVEEWAKENPVKTRQSEFLKTFPNAMINESDGILCITPCNIEGKSIVCTYGKSCGDCRRDYWLTEVTDND
nr:MAG TPA: hypothetical protein [Caudoviricetes sp.]